MAEGDDGKFVVLLLMTFWQSVCRLKQVGCSQHFAQRVRAQGSMGSDPARKPIVTWWTMHSLPGRRAHELCWFGFSVCPGNPGLLPLDRP